MKFLHLSDLHLGKRVNEFPMLADQKAILAQILKIADDERPNAVLIAGDVYDKSVPPVEAVELFDDFLVKLAARKLPVYVIGGNHDSPERLAFCNRLIDASGIHISPAYGGDVRPLSLTDEYGKVNIYMLPFVKPANVRRYFPEEQIDSYTDAVHVAISKMQVNAAERNVLVTHQFVTGAARCDSEEISVGGADNVDLSVFDAFDYVALGHIHGAQNISPRVRYCGTPLKYSFSEAKQQKSVTVAELKEKGTLEIRTVPLTPERDMHEIRGTYEEIASKNFYENTTYRSDYMHVTLTDETDVPDAMAKLRVIYRNLMTLSYDNTRTRARTELGAAAETERKTPLDLFAEFYEKQNGAPMDEEQRAFVRELIEKEGDAI